METLPGDVVEAIRCGERWKVPKPLGDCLGTKVPGGDRPSLWSVPVEPEEADRSGETGSTGGSIDRTIQVRSPE